FRLADVQVYVAPEDAARIDLHGRPEALEEFFIEPRVEAKALAQRHAVVFDVVNHIVNFDASTALTLNTLAPRIEVGSLLFADQIGSTWYPSEGSYRWMPKWAGVVLPPSGDQLVIRGYAPAATVKEGPVTVEV